MGRWDSSIYEIYCRMSLQSALQVSRAVVSTRVDSLETQFHEEHLEVLPVEMHMMRGTTEDGVTEEAT